jgi:hypothetical protein
MREDRILWNKRMADVLSVICSTVKRWQLSRVGNMYFIVAKMLYTSMEY